MKKLLYILLFVTSYACAQTTPVTIQFRSFGQRYPMYTWSGIPGGGYDTLWNAATIRGYVLAHGGGIQNQPFTNTPQTAAFSISGIGRSNTGFVSGDVLSGTYSFFSSSEFQMNDASGIGAIIQPGSGFGITNIEGQYISSFNKNGIIITRSGTTPDLFTLTIDSTARQTIVTGDPIRFKNRISIDSLPSNPNDAVRKRDIDSLIVSGTISPDSALRKNKNLYDVPNKATARLNLGITPLLNAKLDTVGKEINVKRDFGAKGDAVVTTTMSTVAGSPTVTDPNGNFTGALIGKTIGIPYAGTDTLGFGIGGTMVFKILGVPSPTTLTLDKNVVKTIAPTRTVTGVSMTALTDQITITGGTFTKQDIGKQITIPGVGPINNQNAAHTTGTFPVDSNSVCYIYAVPSSTTALVTKRAIYSTSGRTVSIPGAWAVYGTDDTQALQNAINAGLSGPKVEIPTGKYLTTKALQTGSDLTIEGYGGGNSIFYPVGRNYTAFVANRNASDTLVRNAHFRNFGVDANGIRVNYYDHGIKAFLMLPAINVSWEGLNISNTAATSIGCDFMNNYLLQGNTINHFGAQGFEFGPSGANLTIAGAAAIGIGTGKNQIEAGSVIGNYFNDGYSFGVFWEGQERGSLLSTGMKAISNNSKFTRVAGIGIIGVDGAIVSNNTSEYDNTGIRSDLSPYQIAANLTYARNDLITGNTIKDAFGTFITINTKYGGQRVLNNVLINNLTASAAGIKAISTDSTGTNIKDIQISGNTIRGIKGDAISIETGNAAETHGTVIITNNTSVNNGLSNASPGNAIAIKGKTANQVITGNLAFDDRAGASRTQGYSYNVTTATTTGNWRYAENTTINIVPASNEVYSNLTATTTNIGRELVRNEGPTPLTVTRRSTSVNSSLAIGDDGANTFWGKATNGDAAISSTANMSSNLFAVSMAGNVKIPVTPATAPNTYDILVRDNSGTGTATVVQKIPSNTFLTTATLPEKFLRLTGSGTGSATTISIAHGQTGVTSASIAVITPINAASSGIQYVTCDATNINIVYQTAPVSGTNNLSFNVFLKP